MADRGFVILAEFQLKPGMRERFVEVARADGQASVRDEAGCHHFDVLLPEDEADTVWLHEVYESRQAFEAHLKTPHYAAFDRDSRDLVAEARVRRLDRIGHAGT